MSLPGMCIYVRVCIDVGVYVFVFTHEPVLSCLHVCLYEHACVQVCRLYAMTRRIISVCVE